MSWWSTHQFIQQLRAQLNCGPTPAAGTPEWQQLDHADPRKLLALADAGQHHVLRVETAQEQQAEASKALAAAADWPAVASSIRRRRSVYIPRRSA
ncbi:hypothetical protein B1987_13720 [Mycobacterium kansasii]|nr:hypothetical protein B1987_13720 [Mycobacterium kansasii]